MHKALDQIPRDIHRVWCCVISALRGPDCDLCWERARFHWSPVLTDSLLFILLLCSHAQQKQLPEDRRLWLTVSEGSATHGWEGRVEHLVMVVELGKELFM